MTTRSIKVAPSILSADFARLGAEVIAVADAGADYIHIDVMDGHFVPNISFGPLVISAIRQQTRKIFDVHLMITPVDPYLEAFAKAGADIITIHAEAGPHVHRTLQAIRALGKKAGLALNPGTPLSSAAHLLADIDLLLLMSVNPGFGGQSFIAETLNKLRQARGLVAGRPIELEVDGGVTGDNAKAVVDAGADVLVAGSYVFAGNNHADYAPRIRTLRDAATTLRA